MSVWLFCFFMLAFSSEESPLTELPSLPPEEPQTTIPTNNDGPFWGVALGGGWIQDYPGAAQGRMRYLAIPTYKSTYLTIDRQDGVRGDLLERHRYQLSISFSFMFPTDSADIPIRQGMPDLAWSFQMGPELRIELLHNSFHTMYLRLPWRFVVNTDFYSTFQYLDWNFAPGFRNIFNFGKYGEITTRLEVDFAAESYNDLFYQVDTEYTTAQRPYFDAKAGIMEYIVGANYAYYDFFPMTLFIGANAYLVHHSRNIDSPLILKKTNYSFLGGVVYYF